MTPKIIELADTATLPYDNMSGHSTEAEAVAVAVKRGQPFVWKLPRQNTWLVAVTKMTTPTEKHDPAAAYEAGKDAAMFDGFDTSDMLECHCPECNDAYYRGVRAGIAELARGAK